MLHKVDWWHQTRNLTPPINYPIFSSVSLSLPVRSLYSFTLASFRRCQATNSQKLSGQKAGCFFFLFFFETRCRAGDKSGLSRVSISRGDSCRSPLLSDPNTDPAFERSPYFNLVSLPRRSRGETFCIALPRPRIARN